MPAPDIVAELFAQAYADAARSDASMREAMPAFEEIRDTIRKGSSFNVVLSAISTQIGQVDLRLLVPILCRVRDAYTDSVVDAEVARLNAAFDKDPKLGWKEWLTAFAELFHENAWRTRMMASLAERCLKSSPDPNWPTERVRRNVWLVLSGRWPETYDWFVFLSEQDIAPMLQARMLAIAAEIQLYRFSQSGKAQQLLDRAKSLSPDEHLTSRVQAEIYVSTERIADAEREYRRIVERKPALADGYVGLAECADNRKELVAAEAYYKQAVLYAPGEVNAHSNLMNWYARKIDEHEALILSMFDRVLALSTTPAEEYLNLGLQYRAAKQYDKARDWLQRALAAAPEQTLPEVWFGYFDIEEIGDDDRAERLASAKVHFARDMDRYPEAFDGPWGLASVAMEEKQWAEADQWCERALARNVEWENTVRARQASIAMEQQDWATAERHVLRCLELEPHNPDVWTTLYDLSEKLVSTDIAGANRLLERWRQVRGKSVEYLYQNELGRREFTAQNYEAAIEMFEKAIAARPEDPVLHSNAASAAENLRNTSDRARWMAYAIDRLTKAQSLAPDNDDYRKRVTKLLVEQRFINAYGEQALTSVPTTIPLRVEMPNELLPGILNAALSELSEASFSTINAWKQEYWQRRGVALPGVRFGTRDEGSPAGEFRMQIRERFERMGTTAGPAVMADILRHLEQFIDNNIGILVGHEEIAALLREAGGEEKDRTLGSPGLLTTLVIQARMHLEHGQSINDLTALARAAIANDLESANPRSASPTTATDLPSEPPRFTLHSRGLRGASMNYVVIWGAAAAAVFAARGVVVPPITYSVDDKLPEGVIELRVNGQRASVELNDGMTDIELTKALTMYLGREPDSLLSKPLVDWYMAKLAELTPALHGSVTHEFSADGIAAGLRTCLRGHETLRDLPLVFEFMLQGAREARLSSRSASGVH